jgi:type VI secretion system lysozyme-like protein
VSLQRTLLERLRDPGPPGERQAHASSRDVVDSILGNIQNMLNTTQGNSLVDAGYGLPHLTTVQNEMPHSVRGFIAAIKQSIEHCEPRLKSVRVRHVPGPENRLQLRFEISGLITDDENRTSVRFETTLSDDGRMQIK